MTRTTEERLNAIEAKLAELDADPVSTKDDSDLPIIGLDLTKEGSNIVKHINEAAERLNTERVVRELGQVSDEVLLQVFGTAGVQMKCAIINGEAAKLAEDPFSIVSSEQAVKQLNEDINEAYQELQKIIPMMSGASFDDARSEILIELPEDSTTVDLSEYAAQINAWHTKYHDLLKIMRTISQVYGNMVRMSDSFKKTLGRQFTMTITA